MNRGTLTNTTADGASTLTLDDLIRTRDALLARPPRPHYHMIAASAKPGTITYCGCGAPVRVPDTWGKA